MRSRQLLSHLTGHVSECPLTWENTLERASSRSFVGMVLFAGTEVTGGADEEKRAKERRCPGFTTLTARPGLSGSPPVAAVRKPQARQPHRGKQHIMTNNTDFTPQAPKHTGRKVATGVAALVALAAVSGGIAACGGGTTAVIKQVPGPTVVKTVPGPTKTANAPTKSRPSAAAQPATTPAAQPAKTFAPVSSTLLDYSGTPLCQTRVRQDEPVNISA